MKKKIIQDINNNLNEENTYNLFLPSTTKNKNENNKSTNLKNKNIIKQNNNSTLGLNKKTKDIVKDNSKNTINIKKIEVINSNSQTKPKKSKNKKIKILKDLNSNIENTINKEENKIKAVTINEIIDRGVPHFSKNKNNRVSVYIFCIYRRKAYPFTFNSKSKVKDIFVKLSNQLNIEKNLLECRINEKIITNIEEEKYIKDLIDEEQTDKIYVTKIYPNYNLINNLYNKAYNNFVIIENSYEIKEIEEKLNKFLEEYHMEKDYYFKKISDNKYLFGFSYPDFAFDFNRLLLILKRTEKDFKDIKSYLKLEKKKNKKVLTPNNL